MKESELELIGNWICAVLEDIEDEAKLSSIRDDVRELCDRFPMGPMGSMGPIGSMGAMGPSADRSHGVPIVSIGHMGPMALVGDMDPI